MATFEDYIDDLLKEEGGSTVTDDPNDSGGLTKWGISQKAYPDLDIEALTEEEAKEIYKRDYWDKMHLDKMPEHLRKDLFFAGVNMWIKNPMNRALQKAVGAPADGIIGPNTVKAVREFEGASNIDRNTLVEGAIDYYVDLVEKRPKDRKFLNGWMNRVIGPERRPFGKNAIDLRDMEPSEIRQTAKEKLYEVPDFEGNATTATHHRPTPVLEQRVELPEGFPEQFMTMFQTLTQSVQARSQGASEAQTDQQPERPIEKLKKSISSALSRTIEEGERQLERTANEAELEAEAKEAPSRRRLSLIDKLSAVEKTKAKRATGTRETEKPVRVNQGTMEEKDDSLDPTYGIF